MSWDEASSMMGIWSFDVFSNQGGICAVIFESEEGTWKNEVFTYGLMIDYQYVTWHLD